MISLRWEKFPNERRKQKVINVLVYYNMGVIKSQAKTAPMYQVGAVCISIGENYEIIIMFYFFGKFQRVCLISVYHSKFIIAYLLAKVNHIKRVFDVVYAIKEKAPEVLWNRCFSLIRIIRVMVMT